MVIGVPFWYQFVSKKPGGPAPPGTTRWMQQNAIKRRGGGKGGDQRREVSPQTTDAVTQIVFNP